MTELDAWTTNGTQIIAKTIAIAGIEMALKITRIEPLYIWDLYISVSKEFSEEIHYCHVPLGQTSIPMTLSACPIPAFFT